ncbi:hypothetical protein M8J76_001780 [Diaphorina citri]|nr:hypothetical protein M8J75_000397 [Diaphorina citri]KAI5710930.1 hypothetical protein M8J75_012566 [Diaphorina citri]KAI5744376.1 hypothetical protein M8J76_001780 [Diaphorina citri]KAI5751958.1 hypothetical protein M8J77_012482 [Diaphorina citri]
MLTDSSLSLASMIMKNKLKKRQKFTLLHLGPLDGARDEPRSDNVTMVSLMNDDTIHQIESALGVIFSGSPYQEEEAMAWEQIFGPNTTPSGERHILHE